MSPFVTFPFPTSFMLKFILPDLSAETFLLRPYLLVSCTSCSKSCPPSRSCTLPWFGVRGPLVPHLRPTHSLRCHPPLQSRSPPVSGTPGNPEPLFRPERRHTLPLGDLPRLVSSLYQNGSNNILARPRTEDVSLYLFYPLFDLRMSGSSFKRLTDPTMTETNPTTVRTIILYPFVTLVILNGCLISAYTLFLTFYSVTFLF